jgi:hypothetical protein
MVFLLYLEEDMEALLRQVQSYQDLVDSDGTILASTEDGK